MDSSTPRRGIQVKSVCADVFIGRSSFVFLSITLLVTGAVKFNSSPNRADPLTLEHLYRVINLFPTISRPVLYSIGPLVLQVNAILAVRNVLTSLHSIDVLINKGAVGLLVSLLSLTRCLVEVSTPQHRGSKLDTPTKGACTRSITRRKVAKALKSTALVVSCSVFYNKVIQQSLENSTQTVARDIPS